MEGRDDGPRDWEPRWRPVPAVCSEGFGEGLVKEGLRHLAPEGQEKVGAGQLREG